MGADSCSAGYPGILPALTATGGPQTARSGSAALPGILASGQLQTAQEGLRCALGADSGSAALPVP